METEKSFTDEKAAAAEIEKLKAIAPFCQKVYNDLKNMGIPATLKDITTFAARCLKENQDQFITDDFRKILLKQPNNHILQDASPTVQERSIKVPDYRSLKKWVENNYPKGFGFNALPIDHMVFKSDKIELLKMDGVIKKHTQVFKVHDPELVKKAHANGEPILIQHDEHHIKNAIANTDLMIKDGQHVYDMFAAVGVEVNVGEIHDILHGQKLKKPSDYIKTMVTDKLVDKAGEVTLNGMPVKRDKIKELIEIPSTDHIKTRIDQMMPAWNTTNNEKTFVKGHVQIRDGKLTHADNFHADLTEKHTHTTKTALGAELSVKLMDIAKSISDLNTFLGNDKNAHPCYPVGATLHIPGLKKVTHGNDKEFIGFRLDLDFIRNQERIAEGK